MSDMEDYQDISKEEIIKSFTIEDFLENKKTREILKDEHLFKYEIEMEKKMEKIFDDFYNEFSSDVLLHTNDAKYSALSFSNLVYNNIKKNYDITIFHDCPELANSIIKEKMQEI